MFLALLTQGEVQDALSYIVVNAFNSIVLFPTFNNVLSLTPSNYYMFLLTKVKFVFPKSHYI